MINFLMVYQLSTILSNYLQKKKRNMSLGKGSTKGLEHTLSARKMY